MTPAQALHTFARHHCMERHARWTSEYEILVDAEKDRYGADYSPEAYAIFPRYIVLHAILLDVETLDYDDLPDADDLRELLIVAGRNANTEFTKTRIPIALKVQQEERELFVEAINHAALGGMPAPRPLPYRRTLNAREVANLRDKLAATWGTSTGYWFPLGRKSHPSLVAFELDKIEEARLQASIRAFFRGHSVTRVFELRESGSENYCIEAGVGDLVYTGDEGYWVSEQNDWIVYCSHERTITLGGAIAAIASDGAFGHGFER